jgi:hypothetical protein
MALGRTILRLHRGVAERGTLAREIADCGSGVGDMSGVSGFSIN